MKTDKYQQAQEACEKFQEALEQIFDGRVIVAWQVLNTHQGDKSMAGGYQMSNVGKEEYDLEDCELTIAMISMLTKAFLTLEESRW